jgi:hypothetical protein
MRSRLATCRVTLHLQAAPLSRPANYMGAEQPRMLSCVLDQLTSSLSIILYYLIESTDTLFQFENFFNMVFVASLIVSGKQNTNQAKRKHKMWERLDGKRFSGPNKAT